VSGPTVLKLGGRVAADAVRTALAEVTGDVVVVHGAGPQITAEMELRGIAPVFVRGRRVTTPEALEVVVESLLAVNAEVCAAIGPLAASLRGDEVGLRATRVVELGHVGSPLPSRPQAVVDALAEGLIPVVAPLAVGPLNVNADEAAAALAIGLGADRILFMTDVPGVLRDDQVLDHIGADEVEAGCFEGGIVPKLHAAVIAAKRGVRAEIGRTLVTS